MKTPPPTKSSRPSGENLESEFLILPDGRILAHNLTRPFAELLHQLNPGDRQFASRRSRRSEVEADVTGHYMPPRKSGRADLPVSPAARQRRLTGVSTPFPNH